MFSKVEINNFKITIRSYKSFKDWFLTEEDKSDVYKTEAIFYIDGTQVLSKMVPINIKQVSFDVNIYSDEIKFIDSIEFKIEEMNIFMCREFRPVKVGNGTNVNIHYEFNFE